MSQFNEICYQCLTLLSSDHFLYSWWYENNSNTRPYHFVQIRVQISNNFMLHPTLQYTRIRTSENCNLRLGGTFGPSLETIISRNNLPCIFNLLRPRSCHDSRAIWVCAGLRRQVLCSGDVPSWRMAGMGLAGRRGTADRLPGRKCDMARALWGFQ